jgi:hypothetical protein
MIVFKWQKSALRAYRVARHVSERFEAQKPALTAEGQAVDLH